MSNACHPKRIVLTKSDLSPARRRLLEIFSKTDFGRIPVLEIIDGEPVTEGLVVIQEVYLGKGITDRAEVLNGNYRLKDIHVQMFREFDQVRNAIYEQVEIRHGLPARFLRKLKF